MSINNMVYNGTIINEKNEFLTEYEKSKKNYEKIGGISKDDLGTIIDENNFTQFYSKDNFIPTLRINASELAPHFQGYYLVKEGYVLEIAMQNFDRITYSLHKATASGGEVCLARLWLIGNKTILDMNTDHFDNNIKIELNELGSEVSFKEKNGNIRTVIDNIGITKEEIMSIFKAFLPIIIRVPNFTAGAVDILKKECEEKDRISKNDIVNALLQSNMRLVNFGNEEAQKNR